MNDSYKFLGTISATYYFASADENYYVTLVVFSNDETLKVYFKGLEVISGAQSTIEREIILDDVSKVECRLLAKNFSDDLVKKLILAKVCHKVHKLNVLQDFEIVY